MRWGAVGGGGVKMLLGFPVVVVEENAFPPGRESIRLSAQSPEWAAGVAEARARGEIPFVEGDPFEAVCWDYVATLGRWPFREDA